MRHVPTGEALDCISATWSQPGHRVVCVIGPTLRASGGYCLGTKWESESQEEAHGRENWVQARGVSSLSRGSVLRGAPTQDSLWAW